MEPQPKATKTASTFRLEVAVRCQIAQEPAAIWAILTNLADLPRWNSTVTSIEGKIEKGHKLAIKVPVSERTFTPRVVALEPEKRMVWGDGMAPMFRGERTFTLTPNGDGTTEFSMVEVFSGIMLPMIKGSLPDFVPIFEQYARDLKREAESRKVS
ncbi:MAG: SRPBCC domain-containing protein [Minicystis sp.]